MKYTISLTKSNAEYAEYNIFSNKKSNIKYAGSPLPNQTMNIMDTLSLLLEEPNVCMTAK